MSKQALFAGVDLGTSGCRIILIDSEKQIQFNAEIRYKDSVNQTPELWWRSVKQLLSGLPDEIKSRLQALAIDGTSGSILLCDAEGNPTSQALMYDDLRATQEADLIKQVLTPLAPQNGGQGASGSLARLLWLLKHEASTKHCHAVHQADYILGTLTNNFCLSDENNCLKLGFDVINRCWPEEAMVALGIDSSLLPEVFPAGVCVAQIARKLAKQLGLPESLKLVSGTTDSIAAFIATGTTQSGEAVTSLGSTLVIKLLADKPVFSPEQGIYSHRLGEQWLIGGASNSGGKVIRHFFSDQEIDAMSSQLTPNKPTGLEYYPLLKAGERFPIFDTDKQAVLSPRPKSDVDFFQGILEGIAEIEALGYKTLLQLGAPAVTSLKTVGGGSKNDAWTQIRKNKLKVNMVKPKYTEAAYGSALLALKANWENYD